MIEIDWQLTDNHNIRKQDITCYHGSTLTVIHRIGVDGGVNVWPRPECGCTLWIENGRFGMKRVSFLMYTKDKEGNISSGLDLPEGLL